MSKVKLTSEGHRILAEVLCNSQYATALAKVVAMFEKRSENQVPILAATVRKAGRRLRKDGHKNLAHA